MPSMHPGECFNGARKKDHDGRSGLVVVLKGEQRIEVQRGFDGEVLKQLIRVLAQA
jgi:hypothetical protein